MTAESPQDRKKKVVAFVPDLLDRSKVAAAGDVTFVSRAADLPGTARTHSPDVVVVDLTKPGVLDVVADIPAPVIAFANHTHRDLMDAAVAAGADQVLARSAFFARIDELLGG